METVALFIFLFFYNPYSLLLKYKSARRLAWAWLLTVITAAVILCLRDGEFQRPEIFIAAWVVICFGHIFLYWIYEKGISAEEEVISRKKEEERRERQKEEERKRMDELNMRLKERLRDMGFDPDEPTKLKIKISSPHNKVVSADYINDEMRNIAVRVENEVLGEKMVLHAVTEDSIIALTEEVFRLWARREAEPDYICTLQNYARRPPKRHSTVQFVGIQYRGDEAYMRYKRLKDGEKVLLLHEHSNPYDENAVKVLSQDGYHIGYLAREYARKVGKMFTYVGYGWHYHYDEEHDFFNAIHIYKNYMEYEEERDTFDYGQLEQAQSAVNNN
jgi:hypothetical protein